MKLSMKFTNGLPKDMGGQGFEVLIEGDYDTCIALIDEMRKAITQFKEEAKEAKP